MSKQWFRAIALCCAVYAAGAVPEPACAAFFQISENSAWRLGNAFAGAAAVSGDASTVWYNPAALTELDAPEWTLAGHFIALSSRFSPTAPTTTSPFLGGTAVGGGDGGDLGEPALVPSLYHARPVNERLSFGLGITVPFGLATDYDDGWSGRYYADRSELLSVNINPAFGWKVSKGLSIGGGINAQYVDLELTQALDTGSLGQDAGLVPTHDDSQIRLTGDDWSFGYNLGLFWKPGNNTSLGLAYRSAVDHELTGESRITTRSTSLTDSVLPGAVGAFRAGAAAAGLLPPDVDGISLGAVLPATVSVSAFQRVGPKWAILGDITQTRWNRLDELRVKFDSGAADSVLTLGLENVWRYSIGASYFHNERWTFRFGVAFDETPTPSRELRSPRLPDADRTWFALGFNYKTSDTMSIDFGYAYIDVGGAKVRKIAGAPASENFASGNLVGEYRNTDINIISAQVNLRY